MNEKRDKNANHRKMSLFVEYTEPKWRHLDMRALSVDEFYLYLRSEFSSQTHLYSLSDECYTVIN